MRQDWKKENSDNFKEKKRPLTDSDGDINLENENVIVEKCTKVGKWKAKVIILLTSWAEQSHT